MRHMVFLSTAVLLAGCAHAPDVAATYYLPKSSMTVTLLRTVSCTKTGDIFMVSTVTAPVTTSADTTAPQSFSFARSGGAWTDTDIKLEFFPDQRLKTVNSTSQGQGEAVIKSAASVLTLVKGLKRPAGPSPSFVPSPIEKARQDICQSLATDYPKDPLTLKFTATPKLEKPQHPADKYAEAKIPFKVEKGNETLYTKYGALFGVAYLSTEMAQDADAPLKNQEKDTAAYNSIKARQPASIAYSIDVKPCASPCTQLTDAKDAMWSGKALVAQLGVDYDILIPRGKIFGKNTTGIAFDENSRLVSIQYAKNSGAASALNATQSALDATTDTNAEVVSSLKTEADLIAAQQRLVKCKTTSSC